MKFMGLGFAVLFVLGVSMAAFATEPHPTDDYVKDFTPACELPAFDHSLETEHFVLKWATKSIHAVENVKDPQVVKETADYLEHAWSKYRELFGRSPYTAPGAKKMEVVFLDIDCYGFADPPDGPIQFSASAFSNPKNKGIRRPTSAHELFHKMQYAYGFKTKWSPKEPYRWFSEGTAAWAEVFVWGRVSRACKVDEIFRDSKMDLYEADERAMPFWIYFVQGNREHPDNQLMRKYLEACERLQDEKLALDEVVKATYGSVDDFFKEFAKERRNGFWASPCNIPYNCILGPDDNDVVAEVKDYQRKCNR